MLTGLIMCLITSYGEMILTGRSNLCCFGGGKGGCWGVWMIPGALLIEEHMYN